MRLEWLLVMGICFHAYIWLYLWGKLRMFPTTEGRKKQNKKQPKSHASGLSYATAREDRCGYLHNGWHHKMRKAKAIKRGMKTQGRERSPQRSMFGSFTERCIFTTNLTRWSLEEVKDTYVLTLHYIFG